MASFHAKHPSFSSGAKFNDISGSEAQSQQTHNRPRSESAPRPRTAVHSEIHGGVSSPETDQHAAFTTAEPRQRAMASALGPLINQANNKTAGQPASTSAHQQPSSTAHHMQSTQSRHSTATTTATTKTAASACIARTISAMVSASCRQLNSDSAAPAAKGAHVVEFRLRQVTPTPAQEEEEEEDAIVTTTARIIVTPREKKLARMAPVEAPLPHAKPSATRKLSLLGAEEDKLLNLELEMLGQMLATMPANKALKKQRAAVRVNNKLRGTSRQPAPSRGGSGVPIQR